MAEMIITEKPNAAKRIADALADGKPIKESINGVPYYLVTHGKKDLIVTCTVGHLYNLAEKEKKGWTYPVFDIDWVESSQIKKGSAFTKKYLNVLKKVCKQATEFTVATDFDIEGEVIGLNALRFACKQKDANRMKFSTLTKPDIVAAYKNKSKTIEWGQANAGLTRHELDWYYGINLSRALSHAIKTSGMFKVLSIGRVQGPSLKILAEREKEIKAFKPEPFWQIELDGKVKSGPIIAWHEKDKFTKKADADSVMKKVSGEKKGTVDDVQKSTVKQKPPFPMDLTTLQTECYRCFGLTPKNSLAIAQELYTAGLISYPRTSSQKLPQTLGLKKIMQTIAANPRYAELATELLKGPLKPNEGTKTDPAHPSIYPTGLKGNIEGKEFKVYDIIVRRFLATFATPATRETMKIKIGVNAEPFIAKGTRTVEKGWHKFYGPYTPAKEEELPAVSKRDDVNVKKITLHEKETQPPKRYTQSSLLKELEKRNLGTKATRAQILDTLFQRGYVSGKSIEATQLGMDIIEILDKYCPSIVDEELTRSIEEEMEKIREKKLAPEKTLKEAKKTLLVILDQFKGKEKKIGLELRKATTQTLNEENTLGPCKVCKDGNLMIKRGKFGYFVACDKYPDCNATYNLPSNGFIKSTKNVCKGCNFPLVNIFKKGGKRPQQVCFNPKCPTKTITDKNLKKEIDDIKNGAVEKECPKCKNKLVLRKSVYGQFYGCSGFPKCRYTEQITDGPVKEDFKKKKSKKR